MLLVAKLFWFPLAGYAAVQLCSSVGSRRLSPSRGQRWLRWVVGAALAAALVVPGHESFYQSQVQKQIEGESTHQFWPDIQRFMQWSRREREKSDEHYRIAYHMWRGNHISTLTPVFNHTLMYKAGYTPTQIYNRFPMTDEAVLFRALSVKYVMSSYPLTRSDLELERQFGAIFVYRHKQYNPEPFVLHGGGKAQLEEFSAERIVIRLRGTGAQSRIRVHVAKYPRWRASIDGKVVPIQTVPVFGHEYPMLMELDARDGKLVIEYVYLPADWVGLLLTLAAGPLFFAVYWLCRRRAFFAPAFAWLDARRRLIGWATLGALLLVGLGAIVLSRYRPTPLRADSLFHRLKASSLELAGHRCERLGPAGFSCGPHSVQPSVVSAVWGVHLCMSAPGAPNIGPLKVQAPLELGSFLRAQYDPSKEGRGSLRVRVDGQQIGFVATRPAFLRHQFVQFDTRQWAHQRHTLELEVTGAALYCFDFEVVD
jgi:hypothetical protein